MEEIKPKEAFSELKPERVNLIFASTGKKSSGMACAWATKVSMEPPLYAVALSKGSYTGKLIQESETFSISIPNRDMENDVLYLGSVHGDSEDKLKNVRSELVYVDGLPLIKKARINMICLVVNVVDAGDHTVFIGEVRKAYLHENSSTLFSLGKKDGRREFLEM